MSVATARLILEERKTMYHYDDRYYWAPECAECDVEITARTVVELEKLMAEHNCSQPG
jgi:hypothetical protein